MVAQRIPKGQAAQHIQQGKLRGAEIENLECQQGTNDHQPPGSPPVEAAFAKQGLPDHPQHFYGM
jgi:hypothetical protein